MLVMMYGWAIIEETLIPGVTAVWIQKSQNFGDLGNVQNVPEVYAKHNYFLSSDNTPYNIINWLMILISSWDEHGNYDIPAMIDQIISVTEQEKIFYIGHSMGTTGFMVMANDKPAYQDKIHLASFLAPVAVSTCTHIRDLVKILMLRVLTVNSIFPNS